MITSTSVVKLRTSRKKKPIHDLKAFKASGTCIVAQETPVFRATNTFKSK